MGGPRACIDIGGTKVAVSLVGAQGQGFLARRVAPTVTSGTPLALSAQVLQMVDETCREAGVAPEAVQQAGVASCGPFVLHQGALALAAPNLCGGIAGPARGLPNDWTCLPLEAPLRERFASVRVENDCIAALEAERRWGALQGLDHCARPRASHSQASSTCESAAVCESRRSAPAGAACAAAPRSPLRWMLPCSRATTSASSRTPVARAGAGTPPAAVLRCAPRGRCGAATRRRAWCPCPGRAPGRQSAPAGCRPGVAAMSSTIIRCTPVSTSGWCSARCGTPHRRSTSGNSTRKCAALAQHLEHARGAGFHQAAASSCHTRSGTSASTSPAATMRASAHPSRRPPKSRQSGRQTAPAAGCAPGLRRNAGVHGAAPCRPGRHAHVWVDQSLVKPVRSSARKHGVDGQVAARQVFFQRDVGAGMEGKAVVARARSCARCAPARIPRGWRVQEHREVAPTGKKPCASSSSGVAPTTTQSRSLHGQAEQLVAHRAADQVDFHGRQCRR
jgi:hypothetical protein